MANSAHNQPMQSIVDAAKTLAMTAHSGQVDKQERDYFAAHLTPIGDSLQSFGDEAVAAGYLHDIIEDTDHTPESLRAAGFSDLVVEAVVSVTRIPGETYNELITRAAAHPLGRIVKLADNRLNRLSNDGIADPTLAARLRSRYDSAFDRLVAACPDDERDRFADVESRLRRHILGDA